MGYWRANHIWVITALLALSMVMTAGSWGVLETSEARYAEISREMIRSGDWLHPTLLDIYHYHKPPVTYWLTASAYWVLGVNPFAARFFLVAAYCIQVLLIFKIAQQLFKNEGACYGASLVYATSPLVLISVRGLTTDAYLNTFVMLSLYAWVRFLKSRDVRFIYGMAVAMGLGFMTKGPVSFIIPVLAMVGLRNVYLVPKINKAQTILAISIFICVGFAWFIFLTTEDARLADYFFFRHFVDRLAHAEVFARKEAWYYYLPLIPVLFLPWITLFIAGLFRIRLKPTEGDQKIARILAVWLFLFPLIIFSISTSKLVLYVLPLSIGFSLVTGYFLANGIQKRVLWIFSGLIFIVYISLILLPLWVPNLKFGPFLTALPIASLLFSSGTLFLKLARERIISILSVLFSVTLILFASQFFRLNSMEVNSLSPIASFLKEQNIDERNIIIYNEFLPSLAFELDKTIISVHAGNRSLQREKQFQKNDRWQNNLLDMNDPENIRKLNSLLSKKSVLIVKKQLPSTLESIMPGNWNRKDFGKWLVYYN